MTDKSFAGSSGSICVSDMNDTASQRVHEARQPEHHRGSDVQIQARAAQRNGKNASDEQAKGSEPVGQGAQGRGGARWLRSKQGTDRRRQNKCGNAASSGASAGSRVKPTAEQISLNKVLTSLDNPASVLDALVAASDAGQDINATNRECLEMTEVWFMCAQISSRRGQISDPVSI